MNRYPRIAAVAAGVLICGAGALVLFIGSQSHWIPCFTNCGEVFDALLYVSNFRLYGLEYSLVQDMATAPRLEAHPFFYTHNPNIAGYLFTLLDWIGVRELREKQFLTVAIFAAGMTYVYLAVRAFTCSTITAIAVLVLFCIDFEHVLSFGMNPLRVWHWVALFGILFHVHRLSDVSGSRLHAIPVFGLALAALGAGYDFWVICGAVAVLVAISGTGLTTRNRVALVATIALAFLLPAVLRQLQVASAIGLVFWSRDLLFSIAIKVPFVAKMIPLPSVEDLDALYSQWNVLRAPAQPVSGVRELYLTAATMAKEVLLPSFGIVAFLCAATALFAALLATVARLAVITFRWSRPAVDVTSSNWQRRVDLLATFLSLHGSVRLVLCLFGGVAIGLLFFAPLSFHVYIKHGFPLLEAVFYVSKALVAVCLGACLTLAMPNVRLSKWVPLSLVLMALALESAYVNARNIYDLRPIPVQWIGDIKRFRGHTFAVSWIPNSVSVLSHQWAIGISPGRERLIAKRVANGEAPFRRDDLFLFGERDADRRIGEYLRPEFWLYYPIDQNTPFDHPSPACRKDWLAELIAPYKRRTPDIAFATIRQRERPMDRAIRITIAGQILPGLAEVQAIELRTEPRNGAASIIEPEAVNLNCIYRTFELKATVPFENGHAQKLTIVARMKDGRTISQAIGSVGDSEPLPDGYRIRRPQPSSKELVQLMPNVPVVAEGPGYVIFDMKPLWTRGSQ